MKAMSMIIAAGAAALAAVASGGIYTRTETSPSGWDDSSTWIGGGASAYPNAAGDEVWITVDDTKGDTTTTLQGERTIGGIVVHHSDNIETHFIAADGQTATLVLDSGVADAPCCISNAPTKSVQSSISLGQYGATDNALTIRLASPLQVNLNALHRSRLFIAGKLTGGTVESPVGLKLGTGRGSVWYVRAVTLVNPANDFVGDIHVGEDNADNTFLVLGVGYYNYCPGFNSMLGAESNEVYLHGNGATLMYKRMKDGVGDYLARTIHGTGTVRGGEIDPWNSARTEELYIGSGAKLDPCDLASSSPFGVMAVQTTKIVSDNQWELDFDVSTATNDVVKFVDLSNAFAFGGKIVVNEKEEIAPGTVFDLMTVNSGAGNFVFDPSSVPSDYTFAVRQTDSGWTIAATKILDPAKFPSVAASDASLIGDVYATVSANVVSLAPSGSGIVRVYLEEIGGGSETPVRTLVDQREVSQVGMVSFRLDGLTVGATYACRYSVETSAGEYFSQETTVFTPRALTTPEQFSELTGVAESLVTNPDLWVHGNYDRHYPSFAGDVITFDLAALNGSRTILLPESISVGEIGTINGMDSGKGITFEAVAETTPNLTFAAAEASGVARVLINADANKRYVDFNFGSAVGTPLGVVLANPLEIKLLNARTHTVKFNAPISGGTENSAFSLKVSPNNSFWSELIVTLVNANNTFVGDVIVGDKNNPGGRAKLTLGSQTQTFANSMLGASGNSVEMVDATMMLYTGSSESVDSLRRRISGTGKITTEYNTKNHSAYPLALGNGFALEPAALDGSLSGSFEIVSGALTISPEAVFALDVDPAGEVSEKINVNAYASTVQLSGQVKLVASDRHNIIGKSWPVMTVATNGITQSVTCKLKSARDGIRARYSVSGDAENGWVVRAEAIPVGMSIVIR